MFLKVLKYDLKFDYKNLIIFYILSLFFALTGRICSLFDNSGIMLIISKINNGIVIAMFVNIVINNLLRVWARFVLNFYKDESYLTHTLPVEKNILYLSKIVSGIITMLSSTIVIILCLFICYYSKENIELLKSSIDFVANMYESSVASFITRVFFLVFTELTFILITGYLGIIIGHKSNNGKMLKSCIYGFIFYMLSSLLVLLSVYVSGLFNSDIMNLFTSPNVTMSVFKMLIFIVTIVYFILIIIEYLVGLKEINKGVNID